MTHHRIRVLEDGTRVYSNYTRYKPVPQDQRIYMKRKPDVPGALLYNARWYLPLPLLDDGVRVMPLTRPDTDAYLHVGKPSPCRCDVCRRPEAEVWKDRARRGVWSQILKEASS